MARRNPPHLSSDPYLRQRQREFDHKFFDRHYIELSSANSKVRHIREHIGKAGLKLELLRRGIAKMKTSDIEKALEEEIIPNLAMYRTQIANTLRIDLESALRNFRPRAIDLSMAVGCVAIAGGILDQRNEPLEHYRTNLRGSRQRIAEVALPELHSAVTGLAITFDLGSVDKMHAARLRYLNEQPMMGI